MRSDEDMKKWYKTYYEAMKKFYKAKPELICPGPEELIDMLEDLEDQIEKVVVWFFAIKLNQEDVFLFHALVIFKKGNFLAYV